MISDSVFLGKVTGSSFVFFTVQCSQADTELALVDFKAKNALLVIIRPLIWFWVLGSIRKQALFQCGVMGVNSMLESLYCNGPL